MIGDEYDHDRRSLIIDRGGDNNQYDETDDGSFYLFVSVFPTLSWTPRTRDIVSSVT